MLEENTKYFKRVFRYLEGQMSEEEMHVFEKDLDSDPSLYAEYKVQKEANKYLENKKLLEFNDKIQKLESDYPVSVKSRLIWYKAAAAFLLLCLCSIIFYNIFSGTTNEQLFLEYYSYSYANTVVRSANDVNSVMEEGMKAFENKDFKNAITLYEKIQPTDNEYISANFYLGIAYIEIENYQNAIRHFEYLMEQQTIFDDQVRWYLSLCYIVTDQRIKSVSLLQSLVDEGMVFESNAEKILRKIK